MIIIWLFATLFLIFAMLLTYYITAADKILTKQVPDPFCPSFYPEKDPKDLAYKQIAFDDY